FKCTLPGHLSRDCRQKIECKSCKGRHATTLCEPSASARQPSTENPAQSERDARDIVASNVVTSANPVYLQTATVWVKAGNNTPVVVRALLDSGSECTFSSDTLYEKLGCTTESTESLVLHSFGHTSTTK